MTTIFGNKFGKSCFKFQSFARPKGYVWFRIMWCNQKSCERSTISKRVI